MTVMGEALVDGLSDAGSTPARSIRKRRVLRRFFLFNKSCKSFNSFPLFFCKIFAAQYFDFDGNCILGNIHIVNTNLKYLAYLV